MTFFFLWSQFNRIKATSTFWIADTFLATFKRQHVVSCNWRKKTVHFQQYQMILRNVTVNFVESATMRPLLVCLSACYLFIIMFCVHGQRISFLIYYQSPDFNSCITFPGGNKNITKNMHFQFGAIVINNSIINRMVPCNRWVIRDFFEMCLDCGLDCKPDCGWFIRIAFRLDLLLFKNLWQFFSHNGITVTWVSIKWNRNMNVT